MEVESLACHFDVGASLNLAQGSPHIVTCMQVYYSEQCWYVKGGRGTSHIVKVNITIMRMLS